MREDEVPGFIERSEAGYAQQLEEFAFMDTERARTKSRADHESLFPEGRPVEGLLVFVVEDAASGETLGRAMYTERPARSGTAWLYDIELEQHARGRGLGRRTLELVEADALRRGFARLELNVFGGNEVARSLYRSSGYRELAVTMGKPLDGGRTRPDEP
jgi:GNAT superfamily N-acetyltransferase